MWTKYDHLDFYHFLQALEAKDSEAAVYVKRYVEELHESFITQEDFDEETKSLQNIIEHLESELEAKEDYIQHLEYKIKEN